MAKFVTQSMLEKSSNIAQMLKVTFVSFFIRCLIEDCSDSLDFPI